MSRALEIRSYRTCFDLERRVHRVDRWRLPVPWGVPLRGVVYFLAALSAVLVTGELPALGGVVAALPTPLRLVIVPMGVAVLLFRWRVDGRAAHRALVPTLREVLVRRPTCQRQRGLTATARYAEVAFAHDADSGGVRRARVVGPARVTALGCTAVERSRRRCVVVRPDPSSDRAAVDVDVAAGMVLEVVS